MKDKLNNSKKMNNIFEIILGIIFAGVLIYIIFKKANNSNTIYAVLELLVLYIGIIAIYKKTTTSSKKTVLEKRDIIVFIIITLGFFVFPSFIYLFYFFTGIYIKWSLIIPFFNTGVALLYYGISEFKYTREIRTKKVKAVVSSYEKVYKNNIYYNQKKIKFNYKGKEYEVVENMNSTFKPKNENEFFLMINPNDPYDYISSKKKFLVPIIVGILIVLYMIVVLIVLL